MENGKIIIMLGKIYEVIADSDLEFWCKFQICKWWRVKTYICSDKYWREWIYNDEHNMVTKQSKEIDFDKLYRAWKPVMIWDVLDWYWELHPVYMEIEKHFNKWATFVYTDVNWVNINSMWEHLRKPIDEQSEECIKFIYSLILEDETRVPH